MECKRARAYSSSANLGSGFDILSIAHTAFFDTVEICVENKNLNNIIVESNSKIPLEPNKNSATYPIVKIMEEIGIKASLKVRVIKGIPEGLGLGSSGASAAAAVMAFNNLFNLNLSKEDLVRYAMYGEIASSGSPHPDNVAASVFGGVVSVVSVSPVKVVEIPINYSFDILLFTPLNVHIEEKTKKAREMVPKTVTLSDYINNSRYISSLLLGFIKGERELIRLGLNDKIVEKARLPLFPYYPKIKEVAIKYDAIGACVSGAGPSILVLTDKMTDENKIVEEGTKTCNEFNVECKVIKAKIAGGVGIEGRD
ncbi:homoserine kinase [Saccharolobus solfataricus]|uniref:Homoserine kinase n=3 Tax=Saccharolobus solfataricus TaxID=2287 RepID=KHSE_SACS2|nr:homoserine kinase [Saccharolobus solfataricus]Q97W70.1 RecName: Full=Homoserine kinase; Short=HK; Short=HSK [Saccharolobus solfataricus P2]AAK42518.1 Homoserine kinase (thrB) [Saccharolobus solfataricus P2]AKA72615.1 homoserine kinase [Saccharolobus solfataricus]AKA75314.1 homoserine kinase [Saccharolobus solfataricus]AKA78007.1 homoserine kinase [Saccharolobus solfataricus]AZF67126.1 homoserine kinase [Saccharolobus solfataricus]